MAQPLESLGIIAGSRSLPLLVAREARAAGIKRLVAVAFENETDPALSGLVDEIIWLRVGQLEKMISAFSTRSVRQCVMAGQIAPKNLFDLRPDWRAIQLLARLKEKNARTLFGAIADELHKEGVELIPALPWLKPAMPGIGWRRGPAPTDSQRSDAEYGFKIAREIARMEIGQTVVVKDGAVLAVEAFEGTDACLQRGGGLAGPKGGAVAVKVAREDHDWRFDIPCVGPRTIEVCQQAGIVLLAIEADRTLLLEQEELEQKLQSGRVAMITVASTE